jgi:hypothetical protein
VNTHIVLFIHYDVYITAYILIDTNMYLPCRDVGHLSAPYRLTRHWPPSLSSKDKDVKKWGQEPDEATSARALKLRKPDVISMRVGGFVETYVSPSDFAHISEYLFFEMLKC